MTSPNHAGASRFTAAHPPDLRASCECPLPASPPDLGTMFFVDVLFLSHSTTIPVEDDQAILDVFFRIYLFS